MLSLVQLRSERGMRRVAVVQGDELRLVSGEYRSVYHLASTALTRHEALADFAESRATTETLDYEAIYHLRDDEWKLLQAFDHPDESARLLVCGTGLTHRKSADNRQAMHAATAPMSDSMKIYQWGLEGGQPQPGEIGAQPEWFYKGNGAILRAHGEPLDVPSFAGDGGEESEIAGVYILDTHGKPWRVGMVVANEFSDHVMEEKNYLYLAPSKLRTCSIGPEIIVNAEFEDNAGKASVFRAEDQIWSADFKTGEKNMCHTVANLEHHHFKYPAHRRPGDAHLYFFGTDAFSFGDGIRLEDGDVMQIEVEGFGKPLRNPLRVDQSPQQFVEVRTL